MEGDWCNKSALVGNPAGSANRKRSDRATLDLKSAISFFGDPCMDVEDLAFYLVTHGIDATSKGSYVEVDLGSDIYKLTPNGSAPGLCSIAA